MNKQLLIIINRKGGRLDSDLKWVIAPIIPQFVREEKGKQKSTTKYNQPQNSIL